MQKSSVYKKTFWLKFEISKIRCSVYLNEKSKRIINIDITDEILNKLIFPFNKFDITALEYKPFTRFTIAQSLDELSNNKLSKLINKIMYIKKQFYFDLNYVYKIKILFYQKLFWFCGTKVTKFLKLNQFSEIE